MATKDWEKRFLAAWAREHNAHRAAHPAADEMAAMQRKARLYDIICVATPTQFTQIWDRMVRGEKFDQLVEELGRVQAEWDRARKGDAA